MEDVGFKQTLITKLVPRMKVLQFHLFCEYKGWEHIIKGQLGCQMIVESKN